MKNLYSVLKHAEDEFGAKLALTFRQRYRTMNWTYLDLSAHVNNLAAALATKNIGPGDRVLLFGGNSPYWVAAFFGILARGAVVIPLNPQSTREQLDRIVASAAPKLLVRTNYSVWQGPLLESLLMETASETATDMPDMPGLNAEKDDLAEIAYTSGTTGTPKGIMLTHGNLLAGINTLPEAVPIQTNEVVMSIVPLFHLYGQMAGMLYPMSQGCAISYLPSLSSRVIRSTLARTPADYLVTVPEFLKTFMDRLEENLAGWPVLLRRCLHGRIRRRISKTLHTLVSGGAPLEPELELKWRALGFEVLQGYGLTETSPMIAINTPSAHRPGSVGKLLHGVQVKIAEDGEILVKGANVMKGYFQDEMRTRQIFQDGWLKTDDSGKFDKDGFLYVFGRKKYMILGPGGENVFPEDLEAELNKNPEVRDSAVIGLEQQGRTIIHAVLLSDYDNGDAIVEQVNQHLAPHQRIMGWSRWSEADFPRSATRKVKKEELIKRLTTQVETSSKEVITVTPLTRLIASTTCTDPGVIHDTARLVTDLKLDSLLRIELVGRIEEEFNVELAENQITLKTTVGELQTLIDERQGQAVISEQYPRWSMAPWCGRVRTLIQNAAFAGLSALSKLHIEGVENLDGLDGPVIFMANHRSYLDSLVAVRAIPPRFRSKLGIAAGLDVLYEKFWWFVPFAELSMNAYPFATQLTENIKPSLEYTGRLLDDGWNVLIFPEGKMNRTGSVLQPLKGGTGILAVEMQVAVVPVVILGTGRILPPEKLLPRQRGWIDIRFGRPLSFKPAENYLDAAQTIEKAIGDLIQQKN